MKYWIIFFLCSLQITKPLAALDVNQDKTINYALITGSSRGLGYALLEQFLASEPNYVVFATARTEDPIKALADRYPGRVIPIRADMGIAEDVEQVRKIVAETVGAHGLSLLVLNSGDIGLVCQMDQFSKKNVHEISKHLLHSARVNAIGPISLAISLIPQLQLAPKARILGVTTRVTNAIHDPAPVVLTYSLGKAALENALGHLRAEFDSTSISVAWVVPGEMDTGLQVDLRKTSAEQFKDVTVLQDSYSKGELVSASRSAHFLKYILLDTQAEEFKSPEGWDIYYRRGNYPEANEIPPPPAFLQKDWSSSHNK